ncbi:MAG: hypothetical protein JW841_03785 [Deltaproteobacteria bacterium]|nr:hypothetical protein [Deltaproteobacteria bacterium]
MRKITIVATGFLTIMGIGHIAFTPKYAPGITEQAAWFSGSGLVLIILGLLNAARLWGDSNLSIMNHLCAIANLLTLTWIIFVIAVLPVHQAFFVAILLVVLVISTFIPNKIAKHNC